MLLIDLKTPSTALDQYSDKRATSITPNTLPRRFKEFWGTYALPSVQPRPGSPTKREGKKRESGNELAQATLDALDVHWKKLTGIF